MARALASTARASAAAHSTSARRLVAPQLPFSASAATAAAPLSSSSSSIARASTSLFASSRLAPHRRGASISLVTASATAQMSAEAATAANPLLEDAPLPAFDRIKAEHVVPGIRALLSECGSQLDDLEKTAAEIASAKDGGAQRVWRDVIEPLERLTDRLGRSWGAVTHLKAVKDSPELRAAVDEVQPERVAFSLRLSQSRPLHDALAALKADGAAFAALSDARRRAVDAELRDFRLGGVALEGADKEKFNAVQQELSKLSTQFSNNVLDATKAFKKLVTDPKVVEGLPPSALSLAAQQAKAQGLAPEGATPEKGPWLLQLDMPLYLPVMQHAKDRSLREEMYRAYVTRASSPKAASAEEKKKEGEGADEEKEQEKKKDAAPPVVGADGNNLPIIERALTLRQEKAKLLGFANYAEYSMASKMATLESSRALLERLAEASREPARRELEEVTAFAKSKGFPADEELAHWDVPFWAERLREERYELTDEQLRPYFSLPRVLSGLFQLVERLFGVKIEECPEGTAPVWHPDVKFLKVSSKVDGKPVAFAYLDPYSRPEEKRGGAWMDEVVGRSSACASSANDEKVRLPVAHMVLNSTPPVGDKPSLMTFREVETLFHECGHALQHMLTKQDDGLVSGIRGVEWDAVELPSQFMENFCYDRKTIDSLAVHHETGEPLPEDLWQKILAARTYRAGSMALRQVNFALTDLFLHAEYSPQAHAATGGVYGEGQPLRAITEATTVVPPLDSDRFLAAFSHIFAGGYSAGYFSYLWAEVLSADCFAKFEEAGLDNEKAVEESGRAFADTVLALGGGLAPADVFAKFRGRAPTADALLRHKGLVVAGAAATA